MALKHILIYSIAILVIKLVFKPSGRLIAIEGHWVAESYV